MSILSFFTGTRIKIGIIISLIFLLGALGWLYRAEIKKTASQAQTIAYQISALEDLEKRVTEIEEERKRLMKIIDKHAEQTREVRKENIKLRKKLEEIKENDKEARDWSNDNLPNSIIKFLREGSSSNKEN